MSRGYGRVERAILELLSRERRNEYGVWSPRELWALAEDVYRATPATEAQLASVRRAVRKLAAAGVVETWRDYTRRRVEAVGGDGIKRMYLEHYWRERDGQLWAVTKTQTWVQLAPDPTPEEQTAALRSFAAAVERITGRDR